MIRSEIRTVEYDNGEIQRYQLVNGFLWNELEYAKTVLTNESFAELCRMYSLFMIPKHREMYGAVVLFHLPDGIESPFPYDTDEGRVFDPNISFSIGLNKLKREGRIRRKGKAVEIDDDSVSTFVSKLIAEKWLCIAYGELDDVSFVPVGDSLGYLSQLSDKPVLSVNSHFFIMDLSDIDSPYDLVGTPFGMIIGNGVVYQPPLYGREALAVDENGLSEIIRPELTDLSIEIQGKLFSNGINCMIYSRPQHIVTEKEAGMDVVIVGRDAVAYNKGGNTRIPMGGFVLHTSEILDEIPSEVAYHGLEKYYFAVQAGSSAVRNFQIMERFGSAFYDIHNDPVPYPPALYPLDYARDRAPRMVIAADKYDMPMFIWAEGCSKLGYHKGKESAGASLLELSRYCNSLGLKNALNLDGGGSAEIFIDGEIHMKVSARQADGTPAERPIPIGIIVR